MRAYADGVKPILARLYRAIPLPLVRAVLRVVNAGFSISVAGVFFAKDGRVLVLRHVYRHRYPWGLPAGFLNTGEAPQQGMLRELKEETGLDGRVGAILGIHLLYPRHVEVVMAGSIDAAQPLRVSHEIFEAAFVMPVDMPADMSPDHKDFVRRAAAAPSLIAEA